MNPKLTFAEHIYELRKRLMWSLLFVALGAGLGYFLHDTIIWLLQQPLGEQLYYTTPTGAFSFVIKVCCVFGFIVSLPVVMYQAFSFFEPLVPVKTRRSLVWYVLVSVLLALAGIAFAYFVSLPAALHFLVSFGSNAGDIQALITAEEYFNFVLAYVAGFAALFQLPLIITFINKVTPLKPSQLMSGIRYVILGSFIAAAIITPTPDPINQALMAGPIILLYFMSVLVIMATNAAKKRKKIKTSVPEVVIADMEELLEEKLFAPQIEKTMYQAPSVPTVPKVAQPIQPQLKSPSVASKVSAHQPKARQKKYVDGIVASGPKRAALAQPTVRPRQSMRRNIVMAEPIDSQQKPTLRMGVISDILPAHD